VTLSRHHGGAGMKAFQDYQANKTGPLSEYPFGAFAFARLDDRLKDSSLWKDAVTKQGLDPLGMHADQPHVELMHIHVSRTSFPRSATNASQFMSGFAAPLPDPSERKHGFDFLTQLMTQKSRGTVQLKSKDPKENPVVDPNFFADPEDVTVLSEAMVLSNEIIMEGAGTKDIIKGPFPAGILHSIAISGGETDWLADSKHHTWTNRDDWVEHIRQYAGTGYHPVGTCKMGREDDSTAVVDNRLRVFGVKGLRVADCSIMPTLNGGHTQMPAYAIGEKAARLIIEDMTL
jgi:choline dehydrogenase-like flavoprotein